MADIKTFLIIRIKLQFNYSLNAILSKGMLTHYHRIGLILRHLLANFTNNACIGYNQVASLHAWFAGNSRSYDHHIRISDGDII